MRLVFIFFLVFPFVPRAQGTQDTFQAVNSPYDEKNPVVSADGNTLFLTISNHPDNIGGKRDPGDIWISRKIGSEWSAPVHGGTMLNNRAYNAVAGISANGDQLFLHGHYTSSGALAKTQGIAVSRNTGAGWSQPENINIPYFMNKSGIICGMVTPDNSVFVFSAVSYGTYGVDDIYVTLKKDGRWTEPRNLGHTINTQFQELTPSLSEDKKTLYFSTNGRNGSGSFDVYAATRLDDTWTAWSEPMNLGAKINSKGRELYYHPYARFGFSLYTSTISSDGYGDIRMVGPGLPVPLADSLLYASADAENTEPPRSVEELPLTGANKVTNIEEAPGEMKVLKVHGTITDAKTGESVPARISFSSAGLDDQHTMTEGGNYSIDVPASNYAIKIEAEGYISALEKLDVASFGMPDLEMNFRLQPVEVGTTVNLKNVLFAQGRTDILPESFPELDLVVAFLKNNPKVRIELMGHTDGRGNPADNVKLSQERVDKVKDYLVSRGIERRRISGKGYGGSRPIASNDTEESRRMNRRVEFVIRKF